MPAATVNVVQALVENVVQALVDTTFPSAWMAKGCKPDTIHVSNSYVVPTTSVGGAPPSKV